MGELQRRIKEIIDETPSYEGVETVHYKKNGKPVTLENHIDEIFDEAKKEFPKKVQRDFRGNPTPKEYEPKEIDEWFLKWFGDSTC